MVCPQFFWLFWFCGHFEVCFYLWEFLLIIIDDFIELSAIMFPGDFYRCDIARPAFCCLYCIEIFGITHITGVCTKARISGTLY
jgi:hypothetical protein